MKPPVQTKVQIGDWHLVAFGRSMEDFEDSDTTNHRPPVDEKNNRSPEAISGITKTFTPMVWMESLGPEGISKPQEKWRLWEWSFQPDTLIGIDLILKHKRWFTLRIMGSQNWWFCDMYESFGLIHKKYQNTHSLNSFASDRWDWFGKTCPRSPCLDSFRISLHLRWF